MDLNLESPSKPQSKLLYLQASLKDEEINTKNHQDDQEQEGGG